MKQEAKEMTMKQVMVATAEASIEPGFFNPIVSHNDGHGGPKFTTRSHNVRKITPETIENLKKQFELNTKRSVRDHPL